MGGGWVLYPQRPPSPDSDIGTLFSISIVRDPYSFSPLASLVAFVLSLCQFWLRQLFQRILTMKSFAINFTFKSIVCIALTLLIVFVALFYLQGFGLLIIITLLVLDRVVSYINRAHVWFSVRAWRKMLWAAAQCSSPLAWSLSWRASWLCLMVAWQRSTAAFALASPS